MAEPQFDLAKYNWYREQKEWHFRRMKQTRDARARWHKREYRWYGRQAAAVPGAFTYFMRQAFQKHSAALAANVTRNNPLFTRLCGRRPTT